MSETESTTEPTPTNRDTTGSGLDDSPCSGWVGRLSHDRSKHADWGWLRDEAGELIVIVKMPFMEEEELHEHRRNGTDPAQERVDVILSALYGQNRGNINISAK